jgi:hypothetical protein
MSMAKKPDTTEAAATPAVIVTCRQPGFRRAGLVHLAEAHYAAGDLTAEQLEALRGDPMFTVVEA